jgi:uncharacterized protein YaeQ
MALPSTVYRVNIQLSDVDRGVYESFQTTVARHPSETEERLVARLLAYILFFESELTFTKGVSAGDDPDLWVKGPDDRVLLWIEVGLPESERLIKASRHSEHVALIAYGKAYSIWEQRHLQKLEKIANMSIIIFCQDFIGQLSARLDRTIIWSVTISDGTLYINIGNETFETSIQQLVGGKR